MYHSYALQSPLTERINSLDGVIRAEATVEPDTVHITLQLAPDASLRHIMQAIRLKGLPISKIENWLFVLIIRGTLLEEWWQSVLFDIAEAMETKNYSAIPDILEQKKSKFDELEATAEIDDQYVYIRLVHKDQAKFVMLPRIPPQLAGGPMPKYFKEILIGVAPALLLFLAYIRVNVMPIVFFAIVATVLFFCHQDEGTGRGFGGKNAQNTQAEAAFL